MNIGAIADSNAMVCFGFVILILIGLQCRNWIDEWSEMIIASFAAPWENFFLRIAMWCALGFLLFGLYHLATWLFA